MARIGGPGMKRPRYRRAALAAATTLMLGPAGCGGPSQSDGTEGPWSEEIDALVQAVIDDGGVAGAAVVVLKGDQAMHAEGYGLIDVDRGIPTAVGSIFNLGSVSKLFTGAALVSLAEAGALDLDDSLQQWVPEFPNPDQGGRITLRQLVNHTSGLNDYVAADLERWEATAEPLTADFVLDYLRDRPLDFEPGSHWSYSNSGFYLAGIVIERASGMPWADYLADGVLEPAGLGGIGLCDDVTESATVGYEVGEVGLSPTSIYLEAGIRGDGGLCASAPDLARFPTWLESGVVVSTDGLATIRAPTRLSTGVDVSYGLGVRLGHLQGRPAWGHTGGHAGAVAVVARYPDEDITIVVLTNTIKTRQDALVLFGGVAARVFDLDTGEPAGVRVSDEELLPYTGTYRGGRDGAHYEVTAEGGRLFVSQSGSDTATTFTYLGEHTFAVMDGEFPLDRYVFQVRDGVAQAYSGYYNGLHGAFRQRVEP